MARILAYTTFARGHLFPIVPVLDALAARGHSIALRTFADQVGAMRDRGFDAAPIDPAIEAIDHDDYEGRGPVDRLRRALGTFMERAPLDRADLERAIGAERPDALLVDINAWGASVAAEAAGLPWAQWLPYLTPLPSRDAPPFGPGLRPRRGVPGLVRDRVLGALLSRKFDAIALAPLNGLRAGAGLPPLRSAARAIDRAPLVLYMTAEPFEYPRSDWPACMRMVGPCEWDPPDPPAEAPAWLEHDERPLVLVTISSEFQDDGRLIATALEALRDEPVRVVATSLATDPASFDVPSNARVERFLAHGPILDRSACVVCHGGMGITQKALAHGVPVCVVPFGRDQFETARRVEVAGAGTRLPASRLTPARLRCAVTQAMGRRAGAGRIAAAFAAAGGPPAAADAFEALLGPPSSTPPQARSSLPIGQ